MTGAPGWRPASQCMSEYPECPDGDRRCVLKRGHVSRGLTTELHFNRAGFAWSDSESAESGIRVIQKLRRQPVTDLEDSDV